MSLLAPEKFAPAIISALFSFFASNSACLSEEVSDKV